MNKVFTTPCFIRKNTHELRGKLKALGIRPFLMDEELNSWGDNIKVFGHEMVVFSCSDSLNGCDGYIDCGDNEDLFIAIAAKRDNTAINQWWVFDEDFPPNYKKGDFVIGYFHRCSCYCHVATVKELVEYFKSKNK